MHIKTIEQAQNLPEVSAGPFDFINEEDPVTHYIIRKAVPRKIYPIGVESDDIIAFTDKDGRSMKIIGTENGPAKTPYYL